MARSTCLTFGRQIFAFCRTLLGVTIMICKRWSVELWPCSHQCTGQLYREWLAHQVAPQGLIIESRQNTENCPLLPIHHRAINWQRLLMLSWALQDSNPCAEKKTNISQTYEHRPIGKGMRSKVIIVDKCEANALSPSHGQ